MAGLDKSHHPILYITADEIGTQTGGGRVTYHESLALAEYAESQGRRYECWSFPKHARPWDPDEAARDLIRHTRITDPLFRPNHAHFYAGTFTKTIQLLKEMRTRITYTAAAHDIGISKREHEAVGMPFDYPHLTDPEKWARYVDGYLMADRVVCPSRLSKEVMIGYGAQENRVSVIPHGFDPVDRIAPIPSRFVVGYLGQPGPDKGLRYLLDAWCRFAAGKPDVLLMIAGRGTLELRQWIRDMCPAGSFYIRGEVREPRDLYDACCVYVQPSASEGFGCEVLEARAHGRPVICSEGAGARSHANQRVAACDPAAIAVAINEWYQRWMAAPQSLILLAKRQELDHLTWPSIRERYKHLWLAGAV